MSTRWLLRVGVGLFLVLLALLLTNWVMSGAPGEMETKARLVRPGMTFNTAEKILGQPSPGGGVESGEATLVYAGEDGRVVVCVGHHGLVTHVEFSREGAQPHPSLFARLRSWLGW
jgi:hypothetical protein